jgi:hypothetical protein
MTRRTLSTVERVEEVYGKGDFERALLIYEKELAPLGDKYAQYMVGFMHLHGQGVSQDNISALAWYRLSAERGESALNQARDDLLATMAPADIEASNREFLELWQISGDTRILMRLVRDDLNTLKARTGSRVRTSTTSAPATIVRPSGEILAPDFYRNVRVRLETRLSYLETRVEISEIGLESDDAALQSIDAQVRSELAALGVP